MENRRQPSQGESIFSKLFGKKKNQPPIQVEQKKGPLDELRELQAYKNLKGKFADSGVDYKTGLSKNGLTVGDLVDILSLYLTAAQGSTDGAFRAVANIAEIIPQEGSVDTQTLEEELDKFEEVDGSVV